jgi:serine-type D-Ala-D-Ala carboxypeptidase/endopeptidase (penicillin-binding protein 4)
MLIRQSYKALPKSHVFANFPSIIRPTKLFNSIMSAFCLFFISSQYLDPLLSAAETQGVGKLNRILDEAVKSEIPPGFLVSIQLTDIASGKVLMEKNPDLALVPASTMKIVTSAAALDYFKPDFCFVTEILADGVRGSSVQNLYFRGAGDPYMVTEKLFALVRGLKDRGLKEVRGDIVVDDSFFEPDPPLDENEKLGTRSYHAPYSAVSLNFNSVRLSIIPAGKPGLPAGVIADPESNYLELYSSVKTVPGDRSAQVTITKGETPAGAEQVTIDGTIGANSTIKGRYVNVENPPRYTGEVFKELLIKDGIKFTGKIRIGPTSPEAAAYLEFKSLPMALIVYWLNKFSNNFMAEQLCLALGAHIYGPPGTREKGLEALRKFLLSCGVSEQDFQLSEASGLSRGNRLSASALVKVLLSAAHDFSYNSEFISSLGISGSDGTMKEKLSDAAGKRMVRAKTGTLRGVTSLAGYGKSKDRKNFAFAILVNSRDESSGITNYAERIARRLLEKPLNDK